MRTMSLTDARDHMTELADPVEKTLLTRKGHPVSVVLGIDAYNSLKAMADLINDPRRYLRLMQAHNATQEGNYDDTLSLDELKGMLLRKENDEDEQQGQKSARI